MNTKRVIETLNQMVADGIVAKYAIGGAVGAILHDLEPADTRDVDVFIVLNPAPGRSLVSLNSIYSYLETQGFHLNPEGLPVIFGWPVQFLPTDKPLLKEALAQSVLRNVDGVEAWVFTAEHLAAIAFDLGRPKDKLRLEQFKERNVLQAPKLDEILARHGLLERWLATRCD